ncbi:hypothetical protein D3C72_901960 [compost metagenome]
MGPGSGTAVACGAAGWAMVASAGRAPSETGVCTPGGTQGVSGCGSKQPLASRAAAAMIQRVGSQRMGVPPEGGFQSGLITAWTNVFSIYPFPLDKGALFA